MKNPVVIRPAAKTESAVLTDISFCAKRVWGYPEEYFTVWKNELTITPEYIEKNRVFAAEQGGEIIGYFSVVEVKQGFYSGKVFVRQGFWLEHIFVRPSQMRKGVGRELMRFCRQYCLNEGIARLYIFSDPHARGFYEKLGAVYLGESPSSIEGRSVSLFEYTF